ncbi:DUF3127 domain-containing protein [Capnocytophaga ochracea]|uniref:Domain of uncharacterized function (DUF3127) n=1 Tax=Capnocytophaga ochracea TaxID=1018 RepID=A0A2X2SPX8_CAPOC|nr:DUF3127 domain-containing protein [Capnocytophaga ochracea]SQA92507.1 Domain of uncharacterised function (DUF3127) [Capnocytophaga ochracea]
MEIQGRIKQIFAPESVGQNGFQKRDLVITTEEQYPNDIIIQFTQSKCALLDTLQVGQRVKVHFNLQGREWTSPQGEVKYFNTVVGWKIELIQTTNVAQQTQQYQQAPQGYGQAPQGYTPQRKYRNKGNHNTSKGKFLTIWGNEKGNSNNRNSMLVFKFLSNH